MKAQVFDQYVAEQVDVCLKMLVGKGEDYADTKEDDRLNHFKVAAGLMEVDQKVALIGMASKHFASVSKMCMSGRDYSLDQWSEKITDSINYLLILWAMVHENIPDSVPDNTWEALCRDYYGYEPEDND